MLVRTEVLGYVILAAYSSQLVACSTMNRMMKGATQQPIIVVIKLVT